MPPRAPGAAPGRSRTASTPPTRRDAQRNRAALIDVAATAFREDGLDVGVDELARRANVGIATLYRHFGTKGELVLAVYSRLLDQLAEARDAALAPAGEDGPLAHFMAAALGHLRDNRGLVEALLHHPPDVAVRRRVREQTVALLAPIVVRAHEAGELDPGSDAEDQLVVLRMLGAASSPDLERDPDRYLRIVLRGLRPPSH
jgi:AcrR family transcriptional regulator